MEKLIKRNDQPEGYYYSKTVADGVTSEPVFIKANGQGTYAISVGIIPSSGSGKLQFTLDPIDIVLAGSAVWFDWDKGEVTSATAGSFVSAVSAVRCISISSSVIFKILI